MKRDPKLCSMIWDIHVNQRIEIHHVYLKVGSFQPIYLKYHFLKDGKHHRPFQAYLLKAFFSWLEYLNAVNAIFYLSCYLFLISQQES